jgi:hypothetical protein
MRKLGFVWTLLFCAAAAQAQTITREQIMANARTYRDLRWTVSTRNVMNACIPGTYIRTPFAANATVTGMAYNWGGDSTLPHFQNGIAGFGYAGNRCTSEQGNCCLRSNTYGVDCSGFVQRTWGLTGKLGTADLARDSLTSAIRLGSTGMRSGDAFVKPGDHTALFSHVDAAGNPWVIEASASDWKVTQRQRTWTYYSAYQKRRYRNLQDGGIGKIDQGMTISSRPRVNQTFTATIRLRETDGAPIRYDDVTVAILDQWGAFKFDLSHRGTTSLAADGSVTITMSGKAVVSPGMHIAVARGRVGNSWSDLPVTTGGKNSVWFNMER